MTADFRGGGWRTVGGRRYAGVGAGRGYRLRAEQRSGGRRDRATQRPGVGCGRRAYPGVSAAGCGSGAPLPCVAGAAGPEGGGRAGAVATAPALQDRVVADYHGDHEEPRVQKIEKKVA